MYINRRKKGVRINLNQKIPEGQEHVPRLEPMAPIRLADRNHAHYPSRQRTILKKDGSMTDFQHTQSDPHGSHRKLLHVLLTATASDDSRVDRIACAGSPSSSRLF